MRNIKIFGATFVLALASVFMLVACGTNEMVKLGTYNAQNSTFTPLTSTAEYSLKQDGYNLVLEGKIPYVESVLGIEAGNIVAIRFVAPSGVTAGGDEAYIKTSNTNKTGGWNEYGEDAFEEDGSVIWVTKVSKEDDAQIKIKWNETTAEVTYTLSVKDDATMEAAPQA